MRQDKWCVLLSVACVLLIFCAVRAVRRPTASEAAQWIEVGERLAQTDEKGTETRFEESVASLVADDVEAADELQRRQLETARKAQRMEQQEAANELQRRQQGAARPLSANPTLVG